MHRLRTEGEGPGRETAAIGLGVFVGCSPWYGFHLLICWVLAVLLGLNRLKVYLAANVSNPIVAPFLLLAELQVGASLRRGRMHRLDLETVRSVDPWVFGLDIVVGSVVVGAVLATLAAALTYAAVRGEPADPVLAKLMRRASDRYVGSSITGWEFARAKLRADPVYEEVLDGGLLPSGGTLIDVGCGQGLMLALLSEAREAVRAGAWPEGRSLPALFDRLVGIETRPRMARLATAALGAHAEVLQGDAREMAMERCSAVLLFDVLQMMSAEEQRSLASKLGATLAAGGVMLVREADAAAGWRFDVVRLVNRAKALAHGSWRQPFCYRSRAQWLALFADLGLRAEVCPMRRSSPLGNVLFRVCR